jgi:hypothetical protein
LREWCEDRIRNDGSQEKGRIKASDEPQDQRPLLAVTERSNKPATGILRRTLNSVGEKLARFISFPLHRITSDHNGATDLRSSTSLVPVQTEKQEEDKLNTSVVRLSESETAWIQEQLQRFDPTSSLATQAANKDSKQREGVELILIMLFRAGLLDEASCSQLVTTSGFRAELVSTRPGKDLAHQLKAISRLTNTEDRISALVRLQHTIPESLKQEAADIAMSAIVALWSDRFTSDDADPIEALELLSELVHGENRASVVKELQTLAYSSPYEDAGWRLARVASVLERPGEEILGESERRFVSAQPGPDKDRAMAALVRVLDGERTKELLQIYQHIGDDEERARLRFAVAPYLGTDALLNDIAKQGSSQRLRSLAVMMQELIEVLNESQLRSFVEAATGLAGDWWVIEALSDVLLRVDDERAILRIIDVAREVGPPDLRSRLVSRAVHRLAECGHLETALAATIRVELSVERWTALADTVQSLAAKSRFTEAILIAEAIIDRDERGRAQAHISLYQARLGHVKEALALSSQIDSDRWRAWANAYLVTLAQLENTSTSASLAPSQSLPSHPAQVESWYRTLIERTEKPPAWDALIAHLKKGSPRPDLAAFWGMACPPTGLKFFEVLDRLLRPEFMREMRYLVPAMASYGIKEDLLALDRVTRDVGIWWP